METKHNGNEPKGINWNEQQLHSIEGRKGTMLVSAAAGSGKTAVLVERIIRRLCDEDDPCSVEDLLIVTFTRAAAAQMKDKISEALSKKIAENPDNKRLKKARFMLPYANIGTIDSFCISLVRENFHRVNYCLKDNTHKLNISPDFSIIDDGRLSILKKKAMDKVLEYYYTNLKDNFTYLNDIIGDSKSDAAVTGLIENLYEKSRADELPGQWLKNLASEYKTDTPVFETKWGKLLIDDAVEYVDENLRKIGYALTLSPTESETERVYTPALNDDKEKFLDLKNTLLYEKWDNISEKLSELSFKSNLRGKGDYKTPLWEFLHSVRSYSTSADSPKNVLTAFHIPEEEFNESRILLAPAVETLTQAAAAYGDELMLLKEEENAYTFDDILHFTLSLLIENKDGEAVRTEFAREYSENFKEILVDEYQDVSKAQDKVFEAISKDNNNRFMVGDIKQSIYGFRKANPKIFRDLRKGMTDYDGVNYPAREALTCNYRSRKGITDCVNFIFSRLMTERIGDIDYNEVEQLNPKADYPEKDDSDVSLVIVTDDRKLEGQAQYVVNYIINAVENKMQITVKKDGKFITRDAKYSDFCILYRSKSNFDKFYEFFDNAGIPYCADNDTKILVTPEIRFMTSLLKVISNPTDDVALAAVLMSPVYGFTPDEMALLRIGNRKGTLYSCLVKSAEDGNEKSAAFVSSLGKLRRIASTLPAGEFTEKIIDEIGYRAIVSAMKAPETRLTNLNAFITLANTYEKNGSKGISGFVRYLDKTDEEKTGKTLANRSDSADAVKMMTIHKSKGLEFPVVFLINTEKGFNNQYIRNNVILSEKCGIGMKCIKGQFRYDTLPHLAAISEEKCRNISEELRVLYVALTRAKEKMIILISDNDPEKNLAKIGTNLVKGVKPSPYTVKNTGNLSGFILTALIRHPDAHALRNKAGLDANLHEDCESRIDFEFYKYKDPEEEGPEKEETVGIPDEEKLLEVRKRLEWVYPHRELDGIVGKQIASKLETEKAESQFYASSRPAFVSESGLTGAEKGIAAHRFMQYSDYAKAKEDTEKELERLVSEEMLTRQEADSVDLKEIRQFFDSDIADRIMHADKVYKEFSFTASLPVREFYPDVTENEEILIEGVVDCAFEENGKLIILDFKTDRAASPEELKEHYSAQLNTYRKCMAKVTGLPVEETVIYSFRFGKEIKV